MPKSLAEFQDLKYNNISKYEWIKAFKEYRVDNPKSTQDDYKKVVRLKEAGIQGEIHIPPRVIADVSTIGFDNNHVNVERQHNVTEHEAKLFINNAVASISKWNGTFERFYSCDGVVYVDMKHSIIRTAYKSDEFKGDTKTILEVLNGKDSVLSITE